MAFIETTREKIGSRILKALSRESSTGRFIPEIDGLRFIAIASVVLYHMNGYVAVKTSRAVHQHLVSEILDKGSFGVQLFFAISGFIVSHPFAKSILSNQKPPSIRGYYARRLTRLEPPYILNLALVFGLLVFVGGKSASDLFPHLLASMFYLHNPIFGEHSLVNGVAWSLEIECQFYLLAPLMALVFRVRRKSLRRGFLAAGIGGATVLSCNMLPDDPRLSLSLLNYSNYFLVGFLLADIYVADWKEKPSARPNWDLVSVFAWTAIIGLLQAGEGWRWLLPGSVFLAYLAAFRGRISRRFLSIPRIYTIGGMCYTIYLYHFYVISLIGRGALSAMDPNAPFLLLLLLTAIIVLPSILVFCSIVFLFGEKPFMKKDWHLRILEARVFPGCPKKVASSATSGESGKKI